MLRNCLNKSRAVIKSLQKQHSCAPLPILKPGRILPRATSLINNYQTFNFLSNFNIPIMSISTSNFNLKPPSVTDKSSSSSEENSVHDNASIDLNSDTKSNPFYQEHNINKSCGVEYSSKITPLCDRPSSVIPRNIVTSTTAMHLQVTTSPRQHFTTSSNDNIRMGNQELQCPVCDKM